jgi:hypothetical protein
MAFDDVADEGRLAITIGARQVELAAAVDLAVAVIVGFTLEEPLINQLIDSPLNRAWACSVSAV